jgi:hypothetical protein
VAFAPTEVTAASRLFDDSETLPVSPSLASNEAQFNSPAFDQSGSPASVAFGATEVVAGSQSFDDSSVPPASLDFEPTQVTPASQRFGESRMGRVSSVFGASRVTLGFPIHTSRTIDRSERTSTTLWFHSEAVDWASESQVETVSPAHSQLDSFVLPLAKSSTSPFTVIFHASLPLMLSADFYGTTIMISQEVWSESKAEGGGTETKGIQPAMIGAVAASLLFLILLAILVIFLVRRRRKQEFNEPEMMMYETETELAEEQNDQEFDEHFREGFFNVTIEDEVNGDFFMGDPNLLNDAAEEAFWSLN